MPVHPIEFRYFTPEMRNIFTEEAKLQRWLEVEASLAWAHSELGTIPRTAAIEIDRRVRDGSVKLKRVKQIEDEINHDLMAMVRGLTEVCDGDAGNYVHLGATSYDIEDTAQALAYRDALNILEVDLKALIKVLIEQAEKYKATICIGRTHGQHALPYTYGMKFAIWASEVSRHLDRLHEIRRRVLVGKMNGAVGTMASFGLNGFRIQELTMKKLEIQPVLISNQVIQRDRHAEAQCMLALFAGTMDKMAREIRNLQRNEIAEAFEPFNQNQVGSSTMPHKRNPHKSEQICSIARYIRGIVTPALETIALEHERDLTNSALERIIIPEGFILTDYIIRQMISIQKGLTFDSDNIERNLNLTLGLCLTERVMIELVAKGLGRQKGHEMMRRLAMKCWEEKRPLRDVMLEDTEAAKYVNSKEIDTWLDPHTYIGTAVEQVNNVVKILTKEL